MARIESIEELTADLFSDILRENWSRQDGGSCSNAAGGDTDPCPKVNAISVTKVEQGVLSDVYRVHLEYVASERSGSSASMPPSGWLVKFCRPDLDLSWMCRNETIFYSRFAQGLMATNKNTVSGGTPETALLPRRSLPFTVPRFLSGSDRHIILGEVTDIETYPLNEGCPPDKINFLLNALASWHAVCWESELLASHSSPDANGSSVQGTIEGETLVFPTGMGQRLPPLQKEGLFVTSWQDTIDFMRSWDDQQSEKKLDAGLLDFTTSLCKRLATLKLRDVHEKVHRHRVTCVHGDFHIANWLFPAKSTSTTTGKEEQKPVLVDFATSGYGNPLVDLVFFMVVSTNDDIVSDSRLFLERYYELLIAFDPSLSSKIALSTLHEWFPWALLCQLLILVAYDGVCRGIAAAEEDKVKREIQTQHFCNVNRRMLLAIRSIDNWDAILSKLDAATREEQVEAYRFCQNTALVI
jgi:thiamine kinase-like enzyme